MLRALLRFFSPTPQPPELLDTGRPAPASLVMYARVDADTATIPSQPPQTTPTRGPERVDHRVRIMAMKLEHTRLCTAKRCERLAELGIITAGDMATADPELIAKGFSATRRAAGVLKQYRRAIRLAAAVPGMMPRDAQLLISIHRRSVRGLARESPGALYRDLQRFAESTPGRRQLRGRRLPSARRIKRWIATSDAFVGNRPVHSTAA